MKYIFPHHSLQEEKRMLEREYNRLPKKEEIEKQTKELEQTDRGSQNRNWGSASWKPRICRADLETRERQIELEDKELETFVEEQEKLKDKLVQVHSLPGQLVKEMDKMNKAKKWVFFFFFF